MLRTWKALLGGASRPRADTGWQKPLRTSSSSVFRPSFVGLVYIVVGVVFASQKHYFENLDTVRLIASAVLAVALWPLLLLGIDLHIKK